MLKIVPQPPPPKRNILHNNYLYFFLVWFVAFVCLLHWTWSHWHRDVKYFLFGFPDQFTDLSWIFLFVSWLLMDKVETGYPKFSVPHKHPALNFIGVIYDKHAIYKKNGWVSLRTDYKLRGWVVTMSPCDNGASSNSENRFQQTPYDSPALPALFAFVHWGPPYSKHIKLFHLSHQKNWGLFLPSLARRKVHSSFMACFSLTHSPWKTASFNCSIALFGCHSSCIQSVDN